jgi:ribosomal protein RSM22 (predicted rRNA methylase)
MKEEEKILKCTDHTRTTETNAIRMKKKKLTNVTISNSFRKYLSNKPGKHKVIKLQTTAILGTVHALRTVLMQKYKSFNIGNNLTCTMKRNCKIAAVLYQIHN